ncbi:MAG TPA: hypothetical protein EYH48_01325 [Aquifex aeolicus]|uniref:Uncharacterized protein n=1 Tax=Aquifex aeolicus TaxID=63363 RepID=A0A9D0YQ82_AQUAO|nr:hypothetical protein [Aquificales bacterium]HIP86709.1 hypothetical protein [Aquifex sp.]HIP98327.1 hypothetical protein [Aquifex aeolicus]HIQ25965.1 hypothetical protein [Aquifex aeolicus]
MEISDTISSKLELKTNICGEAIQISSRADSYGKALNTLREVQKSLKSLEFNFKELSFTAEKRKEEVTAKVVLILKNPKGLSRLLWHLENVKANYPTLVFSLLGKKCFFPTSELERLKQNLRRKLLKEAQKMADIFGQKLGMKCRLDKLQMEEFKLLLPQRVLEGRAKAIWICH